MHKNQYKAQRFFQYNVLRLLVVMTICCTFPNSSSADMKSSADSTWTEVSNYDGIVTHKKNIAGKSIVAFRGETVINANIFKVAQVLIDTSRKGEWVYRNIEAKDIRRVSLLSRIEYNKTSSGNLLVSDRDFVFLAEIKLDRPKREIEVVLKSTIDPLMPEVPGVVRGELEYSSYKLKSDPADINKTNIAVEVLADPQGSVPSWLVNLFQKAWPRKTLEAIQKQAQKADVPEHQDIKKYFESGVMPSEKAPPQPVTSSN